jgi:hypothetical protein
MADRKQFLAKWNANFGPAQWREDEAASKEVFAFVDRVDGLILADAIEALAMREEKFPTVAMLKRQYIAAEKVARPPTGKPEKCEECGSTGYVMVLVADFGGKEIILDPQQPVKCKPATRAWPCPSCKSGRDAAGKSGLGDKLQVGYDRRFVYMSDVRTFQAQCNESQNTQAPLEGVGGEWAGGGQ